MGSRWTVLMGTGFVAATMSGMVVLGASTAFAAPSETETMSATATEAGPDAAPAEAGEPETESEDQESASEIDVDVDAPPREVDLEPEDSDRKRDDGSVIGADEVADEVVVNEDPVADEEVAEPGPDPEPEPAALVEPDAETTPAVATVTEEPRAEKNSAQQSPAGTESVSVGAAVDPAPTRAPSLLNVVGSVVLNVLVGFIQLVDGPPVLPPNSSVTVRTSTLNLPIGSGRSVQADWYFPETVDESTRLVYFQHGFLASGPIYSYTVARLAERTNAIVVAPSLSSNFFAPDAAWVGGSTMHRAIAELFVDDRAALAESASAAAGYTVALPDTFVLVGHSAGGTLVTSVAGFMVDNGAIDNLAGVVMLDGVEPAGSPLVGDALAKLRGTHDRPIYLISSDRYFWSRGGDMADKLQLARPDHFNGVGLKGGLHIDYMQGGNPLVQFAEYLVGGFSLPRNILAAADITVGWVNDLFAGTASEGIYGAPGQAIPVSTPSGTATAVVLPLGVPARPVWPPLLETILTAIFDFGGRYLFVYEPLRGYQHVANPATSQQGALVGASRH